MKLLKFLLSLILFSCFVWSALFFFGPALIKSTVNYTLGQHLTLKHVKVTPTLGVYASGVEFNGSDNAGLYPFFGTARSVEISWTISHNGLNVILKLAQADIKEIGIFDRLQVTFTSKSIWDIFDTRVNLRSYGFEGRPSLKFENMTLAADFSVGNVKVSKVSIDISDLEFQQNHNLNINRLGILIDEVELNKPFSEQKNHLTLITDTFRVDDLVTVNLESKLNIKNSSGDLSSYGKLRGISIPNLLTDIALMELGSGSFGIENIQDGGFLKVTLNDIRSDYLNSAIKLLTTNITIQRDKLFIELIGKLPKFEIKNGQGFLVGTLSDSSIRANLNGEILGGQLRLKATSEAVLKSQPKLSISGGGNFVFEVNDSLVNCLKISCNSSRGDVEYEATIEGESLKGLAHCDDDNCSNLWFRHILTTNNTEKFFHDLSLTRMFNPFSLALIYTEFLKGEVIGDGHRLVIN